MDPDGIRSALREWHRVLTSGGQLLLAAWEGAGPIDYGEHSDIVALRFSAEELSLWAMSAGFVVTDCVIEPAEGMEMDALYMYATRQ